MNKRIAVMAVPIDVLRKAMHLPDDVVFLDARVSSERLDIIEFRIESSTLNEVQPNHLIPRVVAILKRHRIDNAETWITTFDRWQER